MTVYIFKVDFVDDYHHRTQTYGGMDSEYSHMTREPHKEYILSSKDDLEFVEMNWRHRNKYRADRIEDVVFTRVGHANDTYSI